MTKSTAASVCPHCGHIAPIYNHSVTAGVAAALVKLRQAVADKGINSVHTRRDMDGKPYELSKGQYANWTMLRYHGLIAKDTEAGAGYWLITRRGGAFLRGEAIPKAVSVQNNRVVGHGDVLVTIEEVMKTRPYFTPLADLDYEMPEGHLAQARLAV